MILASIKTVPRLWKCVTKNHWTGVSCKSSSTELTNLKTKSSIAYSNSVTFHFKWKNDDKISFLMSVCVFFWLNNVKYHWTWILALYKCVHSYSRIFHIQNNKNVFLTFLFAFLTHTCTFVRVKCPTRNYRTAATKYNVHVHVHVGQFSSIYVCTWCWLAIWVIASASCWR